MSCESKSEWPPKTNEKAAAVDHVKHDRRLDDVVAAELEGCGEIANFPGGEQLTGLDGGLHIQGPERRKYSSIQISKYLLNLLNFYYVPVTVLGAQDTSEQQKHSPSEAFMLAGGDKQ